MKPSTSTRSHGETRRVGQARVFRIVVHRIARQRDIRPARIDHARREFRIAVEEVEPATTVEVASFGIGTLADAVGLVDAMWTLPVAALLGAGLCALLPEPDAPRPVPE